MLYVGIITYSQRYRMREGTWSELQQQLQNITLLQQFSFPHPEHVFNFGPFPLPPPHPDARDAKKQPVLVPGTDFTASGFPANKN